MGRQLLITSPTLDVVEPRIGGPALIGGIVNWPVSARGNPLILVASLPNSFISNATGLRLAPDLYTSVFSYYSEVDYFLDEITYHGTREELECLRRGGTKVLQHRPGSCVAQSVGIPPHTLELGEFCSDDNDCGSRIGAAPNLLQDEFLGLQDMSFVLQLRSSDFPEKFNGIFGILDALGYLYLRQMCDSPESGLFFIQTT
ncbi:hypothetical protein ACN9MY_13705 [Pseudoduganella sp. R-31]|uniref:hypothetical protein n=1 Tax=Pseudoduganella sp. R-31 TaxID=3404060 RepID=UPI003CEC6093